LLLGLLLLAGPASGATVSWAPAPPDFVTDPGLTCRRYDSCPPARLTFSAAAGERNDVTAERRPDGRVLVRDAGAPLEPTADCPAFGSDGVLCPPAGDLRMTLGDGDDRASASGWRIAGGPGDDLLVGGAANDVLDGGPGRDVLAGGAGDDVLLARDGAVDRVRCGAGLDRVVADRRDRRSRC
jgi:hypothetical protein